MELLKRKIVTEIIVCDSFNIQIAVPFSSLKAKTTNIPRKTAFLRIFLGKSKKIRIFANRYTQNYKMMTQRFFILVVTLTISLNMIGQDSYIKNIEAAKTGDSNAQVEIGNCYINGIGVSKDPEQAYQWYKKAASKNNPVAQYNIGLLYYNGWGLKKNIEKAFSWYLKSAKQGYSMAQYNLGCCYLYGQGIAQDQEKALFWFEQASEQNYPMGSYNAGMCYYNGWGTEKDFTKAVAYFQKAADLGNPMAQLNLGVCYKTGSGVKQDDTKAIYWYKKAADQGEATAAGNLGVCYMEGYGVPKDYAKAVYWLEKANAGGYTAIKPQLAEARSKLGEQVPAPTQHAETTIPKKDNSKYANNIEAAQKGDPKAQNTIAICYSEGSGVEKDWQQAVYWFRKAAEQGYSVAEYNLGLRYQKGEGVKRDYEQAMYWYQKAASQGVSNAMNNIGVLYKNGSGVKKDYTQAALWYQRAADKGNKKAKENLVNLQKMIEDEQKNTIDEVDKTIPQVGQTDRNTFAVIIGNENYDNEADVPYAENDANIFKQYVQNTLGVPEKQIKLFTNATLNNIRSAVRWLSQAMDISGGKGRAIFYYAGHGIPDEATKAAYLLPVDGMGSDVESAYSLKQLYSEFSKMPAERVTVFLDACFSGSKREGDMMASARGIAIKAKPETLNGNMVVFTAAQGDETAYPFNEKRHGMFTYYLLKKIQDTKGNITLGELQNYITDEVKHQSFLENNKIQTPSVLVSPAMSKEWKNVQLR